MYCSTCGTLNSDAARFCEKCGRTVGAAAASAMAAPPPPPPGGPPAAYGTAPALNSAYQQPQYPQPAYPQPPYADPRVRGAMVPGGKAYAVGKSPGLAVFLSFLIPGVGQFYAGDSKKGGIMLGCYLLSCVLLFVYIGVAGVLGIWVWSMIDAYNIASGKTPLS